METASLILHLICCAVNAVGALMLIHSIVNQNKRIGDWLRDYPGFTVFLLGLLFIGWMARLAETIILILNSGAYRSKWLNGYNIVSPTPAAIALNVIICLIFIYGLILIPKKNEQ